VRKGTWKRRFVWAITLSLVCAVILLLTLRLWMLPAARALLATRGVKVKTLAWEGTNSINATEIQINRPAAEVHIDSLTSLTPKSWKRALKSNDTNITFITINGYKIVPEQTTTTATIPKPFATQLKSFQTQLENLRRNCPHAILLNGFLRHPKGEFRFGAIEWKDGQLAGDFTWPGLNDPADFKLTKTNLIVRQIALEIGSKFSIQQTNENIRLAGYARWKSNRIDLDLTFGPADNLPLLGHIRSKGLTLPGDLIGLPKIEQLSSQFTATFTNGQVSLRVSEIGPSN
jgi:hypothetical protein